jgi:four helix bundle protein
MLRSGTNPEAMIREAKYVESVNDFIHKLAFARKEVYETQYWLDLFTPVNTSPVPNIMLFLLTAKQSSNCSPAP